MLKEYLEIGYLRNVTDDVHIEKLEKSCEDLKDILIKDKCKIVTYTLVALDPEIKIENSVYTEVCEIISGNWKTFMNSQTDTPKTTIRVVILDVLKKLSEDIQVANLIWLTSRNIFEYLKVTGKEKDLLRTFLMQLGERVEEQAASNFGISGKEDVEIIEFEKLKKFDINEGDLEAELKAATIYSGWGQGGENPHHHGQNNYHWPKFLSERASKGIAKIVNNSIQSYIKSLNERIAQLNKLVISIQSPTIVKNSIELRNELLWWKEACFSNTLKDTYRGREDGFLQIILAKDYSTFIPLIFPTSANYFLIETNKSLSKADGKELTITDILNLIDKSKGDLKQHIQELTSSEVRVSLCSFIAGYINDIYNLEQFNELVGFDPNSKIGLDTYTTWLFHDMQVQKIINS